MSSAFSLKDAAAYVRRGRAATALAVILTAARSIITFTTERANRLRRFVVIVGAYRRGTPVRDIESRYGCSRGTVLRYARLAGLPKRPKHFDPSIREATIQLYQIKRPVAEIAARLGVSEAYVSKTAREEGISRYAPRPKSKPPGRAGRRALGGSHVER